jgi:hypothetical protein
MKMDTAKSIATLVYAHLTLSILCDRVVVLDSRLFKGPALSEDDMLIEYRLILAYLSASPLYVGIGRASSL